MKIPYNEKKLAIDLILDNYKNLTIFEIINKAEEDLDIQLCIQDILEYKDFSENFEIESAKIEVGYNMMEYE